jgi:hypothetical protein
MATQLLDIDLAAHTATTTRAVKHRKNEPVAAPPKPTEGQLYETIHQARNALYCSDRRMAMFHLYQAASVFANLPLGVQEAVTADFPGIPSPLGDWGTADFVSFLLLDIVRKEGAFPVWHLPERGDHCPKRSTLIHDR